MKLARGFSRQHRIIHFTTIGSASGLRHIPGGFTYLTSYTLTPGQPPPGMDYLPASPHHSPTTSLVRRLHHSPSPEGSRAASRTQHRLIQCLTLHSGYRNINRLSIDYACRPRLRSRLTLGRSA